MIESDNKNEILLKLQIISKFVYSINIYIYLYRVVINSATLLIGVVKIGLGGRLGCARKIKIVIMC